MTDGYSRELALRNVLALGLKCSNSEIFKEISLLDRWGDPAGYANASLLDEDEKNFLQHKYIVGYFILTLCNILEQCQKDTNQLKQSLERLEKLKTDREILKLMDEIIQNYVSNESLEILRKCCE